MNPPSLKIPALVSITAFSTLLLVAAPRNNCSQSLEYEQGKIALTQNNYQHVLTVADDQEKHVYFDGYKNNPIDGRIDYVIITQGNRTNETYNESVLDQATMDFNLIKKLMYKKGLEECIQ